MNKTRRRMAKHRREFRDLCCVTSTPIEVAVEKFRDIVLPLRRWFSAAWCMHGNLRTRY